MEKQSIGKRLAQAVRHGLESCTVCCHEPATSADPATRQRLLVQARHVFATKGSSVTVRDICRAANANVAAVSYHFGGKDGLLAEVLGRHLDDLLVLYPMDGGIPATAPARERLHGFVRGFLCRILLPTDQRDDVLLGQMLSDAFVRPSPAFEPYADRHRRAVGEFLIPLIRELAGSPAEMPYDTAMLIVRSIVSQILFYNHNRDKLIALRGGQAFSPEDIRDVAGHITQFCLGGIRQVLEQGTCEEYYNGV